MAMPVVLLKKQLSRVVEGLSVFAKTDLWTRQLLISHQMRILKLDLFADLPNTSLGLQFSTLLFKTVILIPHPNHPQLFGARSG
jgi:hypothetical protein